MTARETSLAALELACWSITRRGGSAHIEGGIEGPYVLLSAGKVVATAPIERAA